MKQGMVNNYSKIQSHEIAVYVRKNNTKNETQIDLRT